MDLSIIVPVYNVEKYIRPCIESIFKQGLDDTDYEVIIVNDETKDHSVEMIADSITTSLYQKMPSLYLSFWRLRNNFIKK
jgi:glycosyltransferase involved in cell wall biosynthesis